MSAERCGATGTKRGFSHVCTLPKGHGSPGPGGAHVEWVTLGSIRFPVFFDTTDKE